MTEDWGAQARQHFPDWEILDLPKGTLTEGPVWLFWRRQLLWVDIVEQLVHRAGLDGSDHQSWHMPGEVGFAVPADDGNLLVGQPDGVHHLDLATGHSKPVVHLDHGPMVRVNDGKCDRRGRVWFATMDREEKRPLGNQYLLTPQGARVMVAGLHTGNGIGWSPDDTRMYHTDSGTPRQLYVSDFDARAARLGNTRPLCSEPLPGNPDGMCVDSEGFVWDVRWQGSAVVRINPDGVVTDVFHTPMLRPTSCCFAGDSLDELIVTTADWGDDPGEHAGRIMRLRPGVHGLAETAARLDQLPDF